MKQIANLQSVDQELNVRREIQSSSKDYIGKRTTIAEEVKPEFGTVLEAQLSRNNTVGAIISNLRNPNIGDGIFTDPDYDPTDDIPEDKRSFWQSYVHSTSPEDVQKITNKIDRELATIEVIESADLKTQLATGLIAGVIDPVNFIPVGGVAYKVGRLGKIAQTAKKTAQAGLVSGLAGEVILQSQQETRTTEESLINIAADTFLSGILGGAAGALTRNKFSETAELAQQDINTEKSAYELNPDNQLLELSVGARQNKGELAEEYKKHVEESLQQGETPMTEEQFNQENQSLAKGLGAKSLAKSINKINPTLRIFNSRSVKAKELLQRLNTHNMLVAKNQLGIASQQSVETSIKRWRAPLAEGLQSTRKGYEAYKKRVRVEGIEQKLKSPLAFNEAISKALRRGDKSDFLEVEQAAKTWRAKVFDPLKNEAISVRLLPEDVQPETAVSYLTRRWNRTKVIAQEPILRQRLTNKLRDVEVPRLIKSNQFEGIEDIESYIEDVVDDIIDNISGNNKHNVNMPYDIKITTRGPLKERTLTFIDDVEIEDFLESDIEQIADGYTRIMATDVELKREFGDVNLEDEIAEVKSEYKSLSKKAKTEKEREKITKEGKDIINDLVNLKDLMRGNYGRLNNPDDILVKGARIARNLSYMSKLGGVLITSIPDMSRVVMVHGMGRVFNKGIKNLITNTKSIKLNVAEAKKAGNVLESVLNTRLATLADIQDPYQSGSVAGRFFNNLTQGFSKFTGLSYWNDIMKGFSSVITQQRLIEESDKLLKGSIKKKDRTYLASLGISKNEAKSIIDQVKKFGDKEDNLFVANTDLWENRAAVRLYRNALNQDVDRTIVSKALGDTPMLMNTELGKTIGQFKSFTFAATQQVLIAGLQQADRAALQGVITAVSLGMLVYHLKQVAAGREASDDPRVLLAEGVDRSGLLGIVMEANNISEKLTRGRVGINALTGGEIMSRYVSRNITGTLLGPSIGTLEDAAKVTGAIATGDISESDVRAFRRMTPYQNVFYLRDLFDSLEENVNDNVGLIE